jgi:hypothetical protein
MITRKERLYQAQVRYRESHREEIAERARLKRTDPKIRKLLNERSKAWRDKNKERHALSKKKSILKHTYGITLKEYEDILKKQNGKCAICKRKEKILCVDHCHKTGKVRGLLCHLCNRSIGMMKDDISILENAIIYIKNYV